MKKSNLVKEVAKVVSTKKKRPRKWWGVKEEGYGCTDRFRNL